MTSFERGYRLTLEIVERTSREKLVEHEVLAGILAAVMDTARKFSPQDAKGFADHYLVRDIARRPGARERIDLRRYLRQASFEDSQLN